jgi:hypothetical protein
VLKELGRRDILAGMAATVAIAALPTIAAAAAPEMMHSVISFYVDDDGFSPTPEQYGAWFVGYVGMVLPEPDRKPDRIEYGEVVRLDHRGGGVWDIDFRILKEGDSNFPKNGRRWIESRRITEFGAA